MSNTMMTFQLLGGTYTGSSGFTFKKGDILTSIEPLDMLFPNKFLRVASGVATGVPCADRKPVKQAEPQTAASSLMEETVKVAQAKAAAELNEQTPPVAGGLAIQPENVIEQGVPVNAVDVTAQFLSMEKGMEHNLMIWRLPSGGYVASGRTSRALLN